MMNNHEWLAKATNTLSKAGVGTARLDALILLEDTTGKDRGWLLAHQDFKLTNDQVMLLDKQIGRRIQHEPLAYIRGKTEFYGREFYVDKRVLEPRPESETMISSLRELAKSQALRAKRLTIADIGTGSGALAITAKFELSSADVIATDIDPKCLTVAKKNAQKHNVDITFLQGDLLKPLLALSPPPLALLCNLPYVPDNYHINEAAAMEPRQAIFGGTDGLDLYRQLFQQTTEVTYKPRYILTESLPFQHNKLQKIAEAANYKQRIEDDFIQVFTK